jgi:hypothetical protein
MVEQATGFVPGPNLFGSRSHSQTGFYEKWSGLSKTKTIKWVGSHGSISHAHP